MLAALLKSVETNHISGEPLEVWIVDDGISKRNKLKLESSLDPDMMTLFWIKSKAAIPRDMELPEFLSFKHLYEDIYTLFCPSELPEGLIHGC